MPSVIVYGGRGALGHAIVLHFKAKGYKVISIDVHANDDSDVSILVDVNAAWTEQEKNILEGVVSNGVEEVEGIFCVAGGWSGGNASSSDMISNADLMWKQSVFSSTIAAKIAVKHLKKGGILTLTGAEAARNGTAGMIGYGMAKAAVHQLTKSLAEKDSGLPEGVTVVAILPVTLDTPMNRKWMPDADHSSWTPLSFIADKFHSWTEIFNSRPPNGTLLSIKTAGGVTTEEKH
ncbi:qdpr-1 [Pristionchus pacificus]|uniref:Dihydropteridine reductase n=1 Tax=Pristionchus pacificus TaxID=54126 RepID=A0A2A6BZ98_PRIPA|nr:qdpr-1 [Pristionchus pacificus]|eukprot:PDM71157.1 qdpr-1 [Pristionchus pacificus]